MEPYDSCRERPASFQSKSCIAGVQFVLILFSRRFGTGAGHVLGSPGGHEQVVVFITPHHLARLASIFDSEAAMSLGPGADLVVCRQ